MGPKDVLFSYRKKHELLFAKVKDTGLLQAWGLRLAEAGWLSDAIDCYAAAGDAEGLTRIRQLVRDQGDVFLFRRCLAELHQEAAPEEWAALGQRAEALGKLQFAREAFRQAGDRKSLDRIDALLAPPPAETTATPLPESPPPQS